MKFTLLITDPFEGEIHKDGCRDIKRARHFLQDTPITGLDDPEAYADSYFRGQGSVRRLPCAT